MQVDGNGMASIQPDFNDGRAPYRIETLGRGTHVKLIRGDISAVGIDGCCVCYYIVF